MANSEPVKVAVELIDKFSKDLAELEGKLEKIDGKNLDVTLDIDASDIEEVEARLKELEDNLKSTLKIDVRGYAAAKAKKEELEKDMFSTLHLGVDKKGIQGLGNLNGGDGFDPPQGTATKALAGIEGLNLGDDVFSHVFENLSGFEGSSAEYADSLRRFSPDEMEAVNDFIINPDVARAHNRGIPKDQRDGWIGPSNWGFGIGEKWGPEPRYPGDKKPLDPATDFLRGVKEMTNSWSDLENIGDNIDADDLTPEFNVGFGRPGDDRNAAQIDFLKGINRATTSASGLEIGDDLFSGAKFGDLEFQAKGFDPDLFMPDGAPGNYQWSIPQRAGRRVGRMFGRTKFKAGRLGSFLTDSLGSVGGMAAEGFGMLTDDEGGRAPMIKGLRSSLKKAIPTMHQWHSLIAGLLPMMIALAGAAIGLVAALGALGTAGVLMGGIGLLGWGDSMNESLNNVQRRVSSLKNELFDVLRPVSGLFQPLTAELFDNIPDMVANLVEPLKALDETGFGEWWLDALMGISFWFGELLWAASDMATEIQSVGSAFGQAFGSWLIQFLRWIVAEVYNNWDAFSALTRVFLDLILILYNLSKVFSFVIAVFEPFFRLLAAISDLIANRWVVSILAAVTAMFSLFGVMSMVAYLIALIKASAIAMAFYQMAVSAGTLVGALGAVKAALAFIIGQLFTVNALTGGLLLLSGLVVGGLAWKSMSGSGPGGPSPSGGNRRPPGFGGSPAGASGGVTMNFYGDVGNREYQRLKDEFPSMYSDERTIETESER